jgi:hypothetical protein
MRFATKALHRLCVKDHVRSEQFDCDFIANVEAPSAVDGAHPAFA